MAACLRTLVSASSMPVCQPQLLASASIRSSSPQQQHLVNSTRLTALSGQDLHLITAGHSVQRGLQKGHPLLASPGLPGPSSLEH